MTTTLTFVGNATTLIRCGPFVLLTDPNFLHAGQRAHLGFGLTTTRLLEPALQPEELPPLDAVLLSHLHGDHWDRVASRHLDRSLPILTTPHAARRLHGLHGFRRACGLKTWEDTLLAKDDWVLRVTSLPGRHAPEPVQRFLPPVMGTLLEFSTGGGDVGNRVYITGDTLMYDGVAEIARRHPDIDVVLLHLGGTRLPGGLMVTMDAAQGADLLETVRPRTAVPVHTDDYSAFTSGLPEFLDELSRRGLGDRVRVIDRGHSVDLD